MKFSTKEDVDVPIASVWDMVTEIESFERAAMRRGAEVQRLTKSEQPAVGMSWRTRFPYRGKERELDVVIERLDGPNDLFLVFGSKSLTGSLHVELLPLSPTRTRMQIALELKPLNLSARLLVQSLKLAKSTLTKRFKLRIADYSKAMEERFAAYG